MTLESEFDPTYLSLLAQVEAEPKEWVHYLVLADRCEELGYESEAQCLRWCGTEHKCPWQTPGNYHHWYEDGYALTDPESNLPIELYQHLTGGLGRGPWRFYVPEHSHRAALYDLLRAWASYKPHPTLVLKETE